MLSEREEIEAKLKTLKTKAFNIFEKNRDNFAKYLVFSGLILVISSTLLFLLIFYPVIQAELNYRFSENNDINKSVAFREDYGEENLLDDNNPQQGESIIEPIDPEFSIIVPKIGANSPVVKDVDPFNSQEYQQKLTQGVAHAAVSSLPEEIGNTFLFAHSSDNFYNANRYNAVFYLLNKMQPGDEFFIARNHDIYTYEVTETLIVEPDNVDYLTVNTQNQQATLMTCWPPGTTLQRLLVIGELKSIQK